MKSARFEERVGAKTQEQEGQGGGGRCGCELSQPVQPKPEARTVKAEVRDVPRLKERLSGFRENNIDLCPDLNGLRVSSFQSFLEGSERKQSKEKAMEQF